jgi:hypothetical protein
MNTKKFKNWTIITEDKNEEKYLFENFIFIYNIFKKIFGEELLNKEECRIINNTESSYPQLIYLPNEKNLYIILNLKELSFWGQLLYQLSHEMTHYLCRQQRNDYSYSHLKWLEETICEAFSLFIVKIASEKWNNNKLHKINPTFDKSLKDYYKQEYGKINRTDETLLEDIKTLKELEYINRYAEDKRELRNNTRNNLFDILNSYEFGEIKRIIEYNDYMKENSNNLLIDFEKWESETNSPFIKSLKKIQPLMTLK